MSYSQSTDGGATWPALRQPDSLPRTLTGSDVPSVWTAGGWYKDTIAAYPDGTNPALKAGPDYSGDPTVVGSDAVWPVTVREGQAARDAFTANIRGQVPDMMPRDPERATSAQDSSDQAETALLALRDVPDEDLNDFAPGLAGYLPSDFTLSRRLSDQARKAITSDDARVLSGSDNALLASDRADLDAWAKAVDEGGTGAPPAAVRQSVRVPLESYGTIIIERAVFPADASGTHGFRYTMVYADPDLAGVISLRVFNDAGAWLGYSINFEATTDPAVYTDVTPPGKRTNTAMTRQHEEYAGAAAISGKFTIGETVSRQSEAIRWGGEHVGSVARIGTPTGSVAATRR